MSANNDVWKFFDKHHASFMASARLRLMPTITKTLQNCEPALEHYDMFGFGQAVFHHLSQSIIPDTERKELVDLFEKTLPRLQEAEKNSLSANDLAGAVILYVEFSEYRREAIPFMKDYMTLLLKAAGPISILEFFRDNLAPPDFPSYPDPKDARPCGPQRDI